MRLKANWILCAAALACMSGCFPCRTTPVDMDRDDDGVVDATDNCPDVANSDQTDADADGIGDVCDPALIVFSDQYFHPTSWEVFAVSPSGADQTALQGSGELGNSGFYRRLVHSLAPSTQTAVTHRMLGAEINPATDGVITSLAFTFDTALFSPADANVEIAPVLFQDGRAFILNESITATTEWKTHIIEGMAVGDFRDADGATADASRNGGIITFGFRAKSSNTGGDAVTHEFAVASLTIDLLVQP